MSDISAIIERIKESIVITRSANNKSGSGFYVNDRGLVITNKHTVELNSFVRLTHHNGKETDATIVLADNDVDFALAVIEGAKTEPLTLQNSDTVKEGQQVYAIGHPYGYDFTVSKGIISCKNRVVKGINYIQTDVPINPGNSGGPLINEQGEVIGINTWVVGDADNMSFAIPSNTVKGVIDMLNSKFDKLLGMFYCPVCGFLQSDLIKTNAAEYCKNCGTMKVEKKKEQELPKQQAEQAQTVNVSLVTCPQCRTANDSSSNFCKNCGYKIK